MVRKPGWLLVLALYATLVVPIACTSGQNGGTFAQNPQPSAPSSFPSFLIPMNVGGNDILFFAADNGAQGAELWRSDGTETGTSLVTDISPGPAASSPSEPAVMGGALFFAANDGQTGIELWKSDGTPGGTVLVKDIQAGAGSSQPSSLTTVGSSVFFVADDGLSGRELWKTDGTPSGTVLVRDIKPGPSASVPSVLIGVGSALFLVADDGSSGRELWASDGTLGGTVRLKDINPGPGDSSPGFLTAMGGLLYFAAYDGGATARELWRSDGTAVGTVLVKDINTNANVNNGYSFPSFLTDVGGTLFFSANDAVHGVGLWKSDGTDTGSSWLKELAPLGKDPGVPLYFAALSSNLLFEAFNGFDASKDQPIDLELWKSDGTALGTVMVKDINPGQADSGPSFLTAVGNTVFFSANDGTRGVELWKSDGTPGGTCLVKDIWPGDKTSNPFGMTVMNGAVFYSADDGVRGVELWTSEGADAGTVCDSNTGKSTRLVRDINPNI